MFQMKQLSKVLAVINQKGGVGKSTVASILAEGAAIMRDLRVLIVDLDMQCNQSDHWVGMENAPSATGGQLPPVHPDFEEGDEEYLNPRSTIADIFYGKSVLPYSTFINEENGYKCDVDIMLGHPALLEQIINEYDSASGRIASEIVNRLAEFLHSEDVSNAYDLIILDTGPSRNPIFRSAVRAATHVVIPFEPEDNSLQGINAMMQVVSSENMARPSDMAPLEIVGLCPNKVRSQTKLHTSTLELLRERMGDVLFPEHTYLPQATAFPERNVKGALPKSIFQIKESAKARQASEKVSEYVLNRVFAA